MPNIAYTKPLNLEFQCNWIALYFYQRLEISCEVIENVEKLKFGGDRVELWTKICFLR